MKTVKTDRFLGLDETEEYTSQTSQGISQSFLDEAYNNYFKGNLDDFKKSFKTISETAQFLSFIIENGMDVREIQKMLKVLS